MRGHRTILVGALVCAGFAFFGISVCRSSAAEGYLGPEEVIAAPDGTALYVICVDGKCVQIVSPEKTVLGKVDLPAEPSGAALSPCGTTLYVTCSGAAGTVEVLSTAEKKVVRSFPAGHYPTGPALSPCGKTLYVCNRFANEVCIYDAQTGEKTGSVPAIREPIAAVVTGDNKWVFVCNLLPLDASDSYDVASMITVIDVASKQTSQIRLPNGSTAPQDICISPDGKYAFVPHVLGRYQMPTTQLERGWMNTNALTIIDAQEAKYINTVLLDDVDLGAANPWGVGMTADGKTLCVSHAGTHELSVIDAAKLMEKVLGMPKNEEEAREKGLKPEDRMKYSSFLAEDVPNDLAFLVRFRQRIKLPGKGPRGLAVIGSNVFVAEYFSDAMAVVDLTANPRRAATQFLLGPEIQLSQVRLGELNFHDAGLCFQHWQSCSSCHPDARVDALNWDLMNDGLGNPKNNKSMLLAHKTPPSMSLGVRATAEDAVRAGITHIQFAVRPDEDAQAIDEYLKSLEPVPSPYLVDGKLSESAERGKVLFFDNEKTGCAECHPAPLYTDMKMHNVGSKGKYDQGATTFDTPTLIECWRTAPYMHDGHYTTMRDLFIEGKHGNMHGKLDKLTEQEMNDLIEFVLSL